MNKDVPNYWTSVRNNNGNELPTSNPDLLAEPLKDIDFADKEMIEDGLNLLEPGDKFLIINRFGLQGMKPLSLRRLAKLLHTNHKQIGRWLRKSLDKLREHMVYLEHGGRKDNGN